MSVDLPTEAVEAARRTREFVAGQAFGVPIDAHDQYLRAILAAALPYIETAVRAQIAAELLATAKNGCTARRETGAEIDTRKLKVRGDQ